MPVYQRGPHWYYDFQLNGGRYRGPCGKGCKTKTRARQIEDQKRGEAQAGELGTRKAPLLSDFAPHLETFVDQASAAGHLAKKTADYYKRGLKLLSGTPVWAKRLDAIRTEDAATMQFSSPATGNNVIRTLHRLLSFAESRRLIRKVPLFKLYEDRERTAIIEPWLEDVILEHATSPLREVIVIMLDSFMRPAEVTAMRWEDVLWDRGLVFIPKSKTKRGKRFVGLTGRMRVELEARKDNGSEWVFPSTGGKSGRKSKCGHILASSLDKMWTVMKPKALESIGERRLPPWPAELVLYSCRHTGATNYSEAVGSEIKVANALGHADTRVTRRYVHHGVDSGRVMDAHNEAKLTIVKKRA